MRKLKVMLMVGSLVLTGVVMASAANVPQPQKGVTLPQALQGVDLSKAQQVTDTQAQTVRGAKQGPMGPQAQMNPIAGDGIPNLYDHGVPGPHKLDR